MAHRTASSADLETDEDDPQVAAPRPPLAEDAFSIWTGRLALVALAALIATAVVVEFSRERVRWSAATAYQTYLSGYERDVQGRIDENRRRERALLAVEELRKAAGAEAEPRWRAIEASWLLEAGEAAEAKKILDALLEQYPRWLAVRVDRMEAALQTGAADQVAADCALLGKEYGDASSASFTDPVTQSTQETSLGNLRAYMLAVANRDLAKAKTDVEEAIAEYEGSLTPFGMAVFQDTLGFVLYRQGEHRAAIEQLDKAIAALGEPAGSDDGSSGVIQVVRAYRQVAAENRAEGRTPDLAHLRQSREIYDLGRNAAVLHYHRALALEALGWKEEAAADRAVVDEMGFVADDRLF